MQLKLDEATGQAIVKDGKPVYEVDGKDVPYDVPAMRSKITELNSESAGRRVALESAQAELKAYKGIDPKAAREAIKFRETLGEDFDASEVAQRVATLEAEKEGLVTQLEESTGKVSDAQKRIHGLTITAEVSASEFVRTKLIDAFSKDPDLFEHRYGKHLAEENGRVVVKDANGATIMSDANPGQPASLDEGLPKVVTDKSHFKAGSASGGGSDTGDANGNGGSGKKFGDMTRDEQMAAVRKHDGDVAKALELHG